jgi:hypothetical protein
MIGHTIVLLPGSERRFRSLDEIEELCLAPFEKGQSSVQVSTCVIDVHKATRKSGGGWTIHGWLTARAT